MLMCPAVAPVGAYRQQFYIVDNMHDLFSKVKQEEMLAFLRIAGLCHLIYSPNS